MAPSRAVRVVLGASGPHGRRSYTASARLLAYTDRAPRIAQPSFWKSLLPRFLATPTSAEEAAQRARKRDHGAAERRTGIAFLVLGIIVGSNAVHTIKLRREMLNFSRQTDAKLELLRQVVNRVRGGEEFDVRQALGTGDAEQEKEWEQVIEELEQTDLLWEGRKKRDAQRAEQAEERRVKEGEGGRAGERSADGTERQRKSAPAFLM